MRHSLTYLSNNLDFCVGVRFFIAYFLDKKYISGKMRIISTIFMFSLVFERSNHYNLAQPFFRKKASLEFQVARITIL